MYSSAAVPLAIFSLASCVNGYKYDADGITTASLAITCFYAFVFIILSILCVLALGIPRGHRLPYLILLAALVFSVIQTCATIVRDVIASNGERDSIVPGDAIVAMSVLIGLFGNWAVPFLFLSFCLLLKDRFTNFARFSEGRAGSLGRMWTVLYFAVFMLLVIFGAAATGLYANYISAIYRVIGITLGEINRRGLLYADILYTFNAIWYASAFLVGGLAFRVYMIMRRAGVQDKIAKTLLYIAFPFYACYIIQDIALTILFSPAGLKLTFFNFKTIEGVSLAFVILGNGLYTATALVLVICGLQRSNLLPGGRTAASQKWEYAAYPMQRISVSTSCSTNIQ